MQDIENLRAYLIHYKKCLNLSGIETELNLPKKTIEHYRSGRRGISEEHLKALETFFTGMGYDTNRHYDIIL